jgi:hypothetical protein
MSPCTSILEESTAVTEENAVGSLIARSEIISETQITAMTQTDTSGLTDASNAALNPAWNAHITMRAVADLKPHPLSVRVYGAPTANDELLASVKKLGVLSAIIVNPQGFVISGTSRHYAAMQCGMTEIPASLFEGSELEERTLVIESNRQRTKKPSVLGREFNAWFDIEQEKAALRQKAGVPLNSAEGGDARDRAAKLVNLGRTTAERLGKLMRRAEQFETARQLAQDLDDGRISISAAYEKAFPSKNVSQPVDCPKCGLPFSSISKLKKHCREHGIEPQKVREELGFKTKAPRDDEVVFVGTSIDSARDFSKRFVNLENLEKALKGSPSLSPEEHYWLLSIISQLENTVPWFQKLLEQFHEVVAVQTSTPVPPDWMRLNPKTGRYATSDKFCKGVQKNGGECFNYAQENGYCRRHEAQLVALASLRDQGPVHALKTQEIVATESMQLVEVHSSKGKRAMWKAYKKHHYAPDTFNVAARVFKVISSLDCNVIGMTACLPLPSGTLQNAWRSHKVVVLPEFKHLWRVAADAQAKMFVSEGKRYFCNASDAPTDLIAYRDDLSSGWVPTSKHGKPPKDTGHGEKFGNLPRSVNEHGLVVSHEFIGMTSEDGAEAAPTASVVAA